MRPLGTLVPTALAEKAHGLARLTTLVRQYLGPPLSEHTWVGGLGRDQLILVCDGSAWTTRLRYQQHEVLKLVSHETGLNLRRMRLRIASPRTKPLATSRRIQMSAESAACLEASALAIRDPQLRQALLRLSRRATGASRGKD